MDSLKHASESAVPTKHEIRDRARRGAFHAPLLGAVCMLILAVVAASAAADESSGTENQGPPAILPPTALDFPTPAESELTDRQAAAFPPNRDLDRGEAIALMTGVFEPQLQSPPGPCDHLQLERFLSDYVADVGADRSEN